MNISLEWLKDYIPISDDAERIAHILTFAGIEVESVRKYGEIPDSIITARIIESELMDGSDHLQICQVDTGKEVLQLVCGAPNCTHGIIGALALTGTKLGGMTIKDTHIRGAASSGMLCSEKELGLSEEHSGILVLPDDTPVGVPLSEVLSLPDTVFELEITPNRPDLLGYLGIATDLAAGTKNKVSKPSIETLSSLENSIEKVEGYLSLKNVDTDLCPRYTARVIRNVKITDSPLWLKMRLIKAGLRPINNVVDITNYVMLESGHPLHAFDYDKLDKSDEHPVIVIRRANEKEPFAALDGKTYELSSEDLVIADEKRPVALAGVIGGTNSHITEETVNIVLESACFNHSTVRNTSHKHKILSDSAYRFERHLAPESAEYASSRATLIISEIAGGTICKGMLDDWQKPDKSKIVPLRTSRFNKVIGLKLEKKVISEYLSRLGLVYLGEGSIEKQYPESANGIPKVVQDHDKSLYFEVNKTHSKELTEIEPIKEAMYFEIPPQRVDLYREIDLIEEVIRLHGMDAVPQKSKISQVMDKHAFTSRRKAVDYLVGKGFYEVVNLSFTDPNLVYQMQIDGSDKRCDMISLLNPQNSNLSVLRTTLLPQLINTVSYNLNHDVTNQQIFELNKVFLENGKLPKSEPYRLSLAITGYCAEHNWKNNPVLMDFYQMKGILEGLLAYLEVQDLTVKSSQSNYLETDETQCFYVDDVWIVEFGKLKPEVALKFGIDVVELKQDVWIADIDMESICQITQVKHKTYKQIPVFPSVERDISFLIKQDIPYTVIQTGLSDIGVKILKS
ncbi:MAG: phenylalanine--tRNA ligase subunit beta, partial [Candidatus Cloacimonetes bacterium]|nr:phenylalanine--tRNA ligase subunit beta [Candidatus Cloacimonadota bacterium]